MDDQVIAGRYRLQRPLGAGGMSEVWAAEDLELERTVAVKLLAPDADPARFEREARAAAGLSHPNICALYDYGEDGGRRYMVLEYLAGGTLEDRLLAGRPLPDDEAHRIAREVAGGLAHAHDRGLVHRDLKPSNILFDVEGHPKIADFGIAHVEAAPGLTEVGTVLGTAAYISPEQASGAVATPASDVYSFGVILYRILTGRLPFEGADAIRVAALHRDQPAPPISEFRPDAPPLLESVAMACLAKSPGDRPADGRALLTELGLRTPAPFAVPPADETAVTQFIPPQGGAEPPRRRGRRITIAAIALGVVAAAGVGLALGLGSDETGPTFVSTTTGRTTAAPSTPTPSLATTFAPGSTTAGTSTTDATELSTSAATTSPPQTTAPTPTTSTTSATTSSAVTTIPPTTQPTTTVAETTTTTTEAATTTTAPTTDTTPTTTAPTTARLSDTTATTTAPATTAAASG